VTRRLVLAVLLACLGAAIYLAIRAHRDLTDFEVYRSAADRASHAEPLYRADDGHYQFKYLPAFAIVARPLVWIGDEPAKVAWFALSFVLVVVFLQTLLTHVRDRRLPAAALALITCIVMAKFFIRELALGQTNALLGVLTLPAVVAARRRPLLAGLGVGAAVFVKPYAAILLPWLLFAAPATATIAAAGAIIAGLLLPVATYGWQGNLALLDAWRQTVTDTTSPNLLHPDNISMASFWAKWLGEGSTAYGLAIASAIVLLLIAIAIIRAGRRKANTDFLEAGVLLFAIPLLSPQGWDYVLLVGAPVVILAIDRWKELTPTARGLVAAALFVFAFPLRLAVSVDAYNAVMATGVVSVAALIVLGIAAVMRRRTIA
jgi:hypothetical protein